jgi:hypothetical protein
MNYSSECICTACFAVGLIYSSDGSKPGLSKLYLTAMDGIEGVTPRDALFMLQGSAASQYWATEAGGGLNAYGLSPGRTAGGCQPLLVCSTLQVMFRAGGCMIVMRRAITAHQSIAANSKLSDGF